MPAGPANRAHSWQTTNRLLRDYPGTIGIKTGWTDAAGTCLLFETVRAGIPLIGVVLVEILVMLVVMVATVLVN